MTIKTFKSLWSRCWHQPKPW